MKAVLDSRQWQHNPTVFGVRGKEQQFPERPERIQVLKTGAIEAGCEMVPASDHGMAPIAAIHSPRYLAFLLTIFEEWTAIEGTSAEVRPNIHPMSLQVQYPDSPVGRAGFHLGDTSCPIAQGTWTSAYWSAQTALTAADLVLSGQRAAYALCRPPGHHASSEVAGGFCYLNNIAIVAHYLALKGHRPAIIDVDVHHGNGTQQIFYDRGDVLTVSIHADSREFYPFFWGAAEERGRGAGLGYNWNIPLEKGSADEPFLAAVSAGLDKAALFGADIVVVALGLDAFVDDPFRQLAVTSSGFGEMGKLLASARKPTVFVQEGGYLARGLGENLRRVLVGFESE
jgi:acetoin utilization deacetylase AcuC-like enzyme